MKVNSADHMENGCLLYGILCIKLAVGSELKNTVGLEKLVAIDLEIDIQPVSTKYFF